MRLLFLIFLLSGSASAQIGMGEWRLHVPSRKAMDVVSANNKIYAAFQNGVCEYDLSSNEITLWNAVNSLSDISISCLGMCSTDNSIMVGYANGNIDKIKNNSVTNIPAIKLAQVQGSKEIFKLIEHGNYIYAATGFSIVKIDPKKNEVRDTYYPTNGNQAILDIAFLDDTIYAISSDKLYRGAMNNPALADPTQWTVDNRLPASPINGYQEVEVVNQQIFVLHKDEAYAQDSIYLLTDTGAVSVIHESFDMEINSMNTVQSKLTVNYYTGSILYNSDLSQFENFNHYTFGSVMNVQSMIYSDEKYWFADNDYGLVKFINNWNNEQIVFSGPPKNDFYSMDWSNGRLAVTSGGLSLVAQTYNHGGVYIFEDEKWSLFDGNKINSWQGENIWDFLAASINPTNKEEIAVGTYSWVPMTIIDKTTGNANLFTPDNSELRFTSLGNGSGMVSDLEYDDSGNLWLLNSYSSNPLKVYTSGKEWYTFNLGTPASNQFTRKLAIDYNNNKWLSVKGVGMYGYKDNGTVSAANDDQYILLNTGENTGALPSNDVTAIAVDFDNEIWIGTDNGFAILYNSNSAFDASPGEYNAKRIKLEYEGNVEYMLGNTYITDIVVDGGNRKWISTANAGILLLSPDGMEILEQHTTENSPLISDNVLDLELDQNSGELFIITDMGLVSYRSNATYEDPDYSDVTVFPNPARPDFDGPITIQGIRYNSDVKITDAAGNLVYKTTSNGGTATWDGKTLQGEKVKTGVYLIWTAANEGKGRYVGKVLIVN